MKFFMRMAKSKDLLLAFPFFYVPDVSIVLQILQMLVLTVMEASCTIKCTLVHKKFAIQAEKRKKFLQSSGWPVHPKS